MDNNYNGFDPFGNDNQDNDTKAKTQFDQQDNFNYQVNNQTNNQANNQANNQVNNQANQSQNSYYPQSNYYYQPTTTVKTKAKKDKKRISASMLVACCLVCAIIASATSSGAVYFLMTQNNQAAQNGSTKTTINIEKDATNSVSAIAQKAVPSVVGISVTASVNTIFGFSADASSEGSGVIYSKDGYIITNYHVVSSTIENSNSNNTGNISVYLSTDPETAIEAKVVGYNSDYDLAVLKIERNDLTPIEFADSNSVEVGDMAVAIGNPGGKQFMSSVSSGIISGLDRTIQLEGTARMKLLQTDAAINPGNSGGALVDYNGQLVGINSSKISSEEYEGMGFAIPSNTVKKQVNSIINNKDKKYAYVGVKISTDYTAEYLTQMGYPAGAVVESVTEDSPADRLGIRSADIITSFGGVKINDYEDYNTERLKHNPGEKVEITIFRNGKYYDASLTLGESNN